MISLALSAYFNTCACTTHTYCTFTYFALLNSCPLGSGLLATARYISTKVRNISGWSKWEWEAVMWACTHAFVLISSSVPQSILKFVYSKTNLNPLTQYQSLQVCRAHLGIAQYHTIQWNWNNYKGYSIRGNSISAKGGITAAQARTQNYTSTSSLYSPKSYQIISACTVQHQCYL